MKWEEAKARLGGVTNGEPLERELEQWRDTARSEMAGRRAAEAEARRLEGLAQEIEDEAKRVPFGETFHGGPLHGASLYNVMLWAVRRIREREARNG